ncbi:hypothetical protein Y032_0079g1282 [Ancylostoma ceylanicum]|uniref:Uncharacterized protein n=1 Tax=Ancylostoma ceylanicum TaxID=53326 RepID=A0A016TT87_9BILA|nr:hypothetical protein Y032_0079g1282 [Ancylostoma ceylanicum]
MYNHCKVTGYNYTCPNTMNKCATVSLDTFCCPNGQSHGKALDLTRPDVSSSDPQYVAAQICQGLGEVWTNSLSTTSPINVSPSNIQP